MEINRARAVCLTAGVLVLLLTGCDDSSSTGPLPAPPSPPGHVMFLFGMTNDQTGAEDFVAVTANPDVIDRARAELSKPRADRTFHINGPIVRGDGECNLKWSWCFEPGEWDLTEVSIEVCDGRPSAVEQDLDYWVDQVGRFCPWDSRVLAELE